MSGGGDGVINLWTLDRKSGRLLDNPTSLENGDESVLALALDGTLLYSGRLEGDVNVWDLDTRQLIRTVKAHTTDVLTLTVGHGHIFTGSAKGFAKVSHSLPSLIWEVFNACERNSICDTSAFQNGKRTTSLFLLQQPQRIIARRSTSQEGTMTVLQSGT